MINYNETTFNKLVGKYDTTIFSFMEEVGTSKGDSNIINELFTRQDSNEPDVAIHGTTAHSDAKPHTGTRNYEDIAEWYTKKIDFDEFSLTEVFGRKFLDDNKLLNMQNRGVSLMRSAYRTHENFAAQVFINCDQSSFTKDGKSYDWTLSADNVAFVSDSHTSVTGRCNTLDNKTTNALDGDNFQTAINTIGKFEDDNGNQGTYFGDTLVVGIDLVKPALELINSDGKATTANRDYNIYQGSMRLIVWNRFKQQSGKTGYPWLLIDSESAKEDLYFLDRVKPEITDNRNWQTMTWEVGVYFRFAIGIYGWRWCVGNIPA